MLHNQSVNVIPHSIKETYRHLVQHVKLSAVLEILNGFFMANVGKTLAIDLIDLVSNLRWGKE